MQRENAGNNAQILRVIMDTQDFETLELIRDIASAKLGLDEAYGKIDMLQDEITKQRLRDWKEKYGSIPNCEELKAGSTACK